MNAPHVTQWSLVLRAARPGDGQAPALEQLCRTYWPAVFAHVRSRGHGEEEARDLTQGFFCRVLERNWLAPASQERGRFRSFLLTMVSRYLGNERERENAARRGGGHTIISLDEAVALEPPDPRDTPEQAYDRQWARQTLAAALPRLERALADAGKPELFTVLSPFLSRDPEPEEYTAAAAALGWAAKSTAVAVQRLRARYRECVREEIAETLDDLSLVDAEMKHLMDALCRQ